MLPRSQTSLVAPLIAATVLVTGCGPAGEVPSLTGLRCQRADACQSREDPFRMELAVEYLDQDRDLAAGTWSAWVEDRPVLVDALLGPVFEASGADPDSDTGLLWLAVPLELTNIREGMEFMVSTRVVDGAGHQSNRPGVRFRLELE